jgi:RNA polymerase sigma-70 factor (ECF subfamily)
MRVGSVAFPEPARRGTASGQGEASIVQLSDEELAARAKRDADAFAAIYDRYVDRIYRYVRYRTADPLDAQDLTSDVFFRALRSIGGYTPSAPFYAWIYRIARNAVIDHHRARRDDLPLATVSDPADTQPLVDPEREAIAGDRRDRLARALRFLPEDQQEVIVLRFIEGLSPEECGHVLGKRPASIRDLQFRALRALRSHISPEELTA